MSDCISASDTIVRRRRSAMTLVELMVAIALSAMLLVALIGVLGGIAKQSKLADRYDLPVWPNRFIILLRRDLGAAESIWMDRDVLWIRTDVPSYQSDTTGVREIGYRCALVGNEAFALERIDSGQISRLALGLQKLEMERIDSTGTPQPLPRDPGPVPDRVRVWVWDDLTRNPIYQRDVVLH